MTDQQSDFMMQLYGALILCVTLSAACGLSCYSCIAADPKSCTETISCAFAFNRCFSLRVDGEGINTVTKGCQTSTLCSSPMSCCEGDLCNSAIPDGPSASNVSPKSCQNKGTCGGPIPCCEEDRYNSAIPTGPSAILLMVSSAIFKLLF